MTVQSAQSIVQLFTTRVFATGVGTNADSLPTGTLYLNGAANGATVTVTNITTGLYKAAVTLPTLAIDDEVELIITATVSTITDKAVIWGDSKDILVDGSGDVTFNNTSITTTTNLTNAPTSGDFTATMKTSLNASTPASVTTVTGNVNGSVGSVFGAVGSVTGNIGGSMAGSVVGSVGSVLAGGLIDLTTTTFAEPTGVPAATATLKDKIGWLQALARNKITQTATTETLFRDDGTTTTSTSTDSDDGTTFTRGKWS